jgi:sugar/nucleoside kinase (ribokinase family)
MSTPTHSVTGIGNAIVDILALAEDSFITAQGMAKGSMSLIDADRALALSSQVKNPTRRSGGSAANTIAGLASLGAKAGYIGKVGKDELGGLFSSDLRALGVAFSTPACESGTPTARCVVLVSPDAQRTMATYLGASVELEPTDVDAALIADSAVTYLEGYLWDPPKAKAAFLLAAKIAHEAGRKVALSLSDSFCVGRHRDSFLDLVKNHVDILFANESEILGLYQVADVASAMRLAKDECQIVAVTQGAAGCSVSFQGEVLEVPCEPVAKVVDTTGAGDLFAAGFLHGLTTGRGGRESAILGGIAAAEVISHVGARPDKSLATLAAARLARP